MRMISTWDISLFLFITENEPGIFNVNLLYCSGSQKQNALSQAWLHNLFPYIYAKAKARPHLHCLHQREGEQEAKGK